ncbi:hypothetical protein LPTSP4_11680 [Leptospira ryugenii]|uniref:Uncharacterized protein n=1 Tax=Leptospira ryugenii TaxID=1917863 RepID=A0A2P2DYG2_9LEPT|nr:hypothetical protein [Leptospira ryugenii]GBF49652.1 hypothetical protein LPTSP4_11680 [Leptospira ryugenii]
MRRIFLFLLLGLIQCQTVNVLRDPYVYHGKESGNLYQSYAGKFRCFIPVDWRRAVVNESKYGISFYDEDIGLFKVQAIPLQKTYFENQKLVGNEQNLVPFVKDILVRSIGKQKKNYQIKSEMYSPDVEDGAFFFVLELPKDIDIKENTFALLALQKDGFIYLITRDISSQADESPLESKVLDFYSRLEFFPPSVQSVLNQSNDLKNEDAEEEEGLGLGLSGGSSGSASFDLSGIIQILQRNLNIPSSRFDIKPGRFKMNSGISSNRFKTPNRVHVKPGRFKNSFRPSRWRP